jgi:hypothetical protein
MQRVRINRPARIRRGRVAAGCAVRHRASEAGKGLRASPEAVARACPQAKSRAGPVARQPPSPRCSRQGVHPMHRSRGDARMVITGRRRDISEVRADEGINEHVYTRKVSSGDACAAIEELRLPKPGTAGSQRFARKEMSPNDAHMQMDQRPGGRSRHEVGGRRSFDDARRRSQNST